MSTENWIWKIIMKHWNQKIVYLTHYVRFRSSSKIKVNYTIHTLICTVLSVIVIEFILGNTELIENIFYFCHYRNKRCNEVILSVHPFGCIMENEYQTVNQRILKSTQCDGFPPSAQPWHALSLKTLWLMACIFQINKTLGQTRQIIKKKKNI